MDMEPMPEDDEAAGAFDAAFFVAIFFNSPF
jgi:hypothetical protein